MVSKSVRVLLALKAAVSRRFSRNGIFSLFRLSPPPGKTVVYIDLGLHRTARQVKLMLRWFGKVCDLKVHAFEANPHYHQSAAEIFKGDSRVVSVNAAVVGPDHSAETVKLYLDGVQGLGDSVYSERGNRSIEVPAMRLSQYLRGTGIDLAQCITILRMNIEGSELPVLHDLLSNSMADQIDGWFGRWNDCAKISPDLGADLETLKMENGIKNISFNDNDSKAPFSWLREAIIRYELVTVMLEDKSLNRAS